jgi:DNA mismatch repair protein MutS2
MPAGKAVSVSPLDRQALLEKSKSLLGWPEILEALARHALSPRGQSACRNLPLALSRSQAEESLAYTEEMHELLGQAKTFPLTGFEDISLPVEKARAEGVLTIESLEQIGHLLEVSGRLKVFFRDKNFSGPNSRFPRVSAEARQLDPVQTLRASLDESLDYQGGLKDSASPELKRLRTRHRRLRNRIHKRLENMLTQAEITPYLQDQFYTQRNQRYVLPVKAEERPRFEGIVHDSSGSGATVFLEPAELIEPNNQLRLLELEIVGEEGRILKGLSEEVADAAEAILINQQVLTRLDVLQAKARLAMQMSEGPEGNASRPSLNEDARIELKVARHPLLLLRREDVVPNNLELGKDKKVLIISGPNAGGKTVCLKMVGLLSLMVRAGLFIPASPDSSLPVFPEVFADIGDEQDLARDISTYSGHLLNIIGILRHAGSSKESARGALVLLDEIAASTDPVEGAALAGAVLRELRDKVALTVATTHLGSLKVLAENEPGFENAGLEFDPQTLTPTYRLRIGVPGLSLGIQTAAILGLPERLIHQARTLLDSDTVRVDELVRRLEIERGNLENDRKAIQAEARGLKELTEEYRERLERLKEREKGFKQEVKARLREEVSRAQEEVAEIIQKLKMNRTIRKAQAAKSELEVMKERLEDEYPDDIPEGQIPGPDQLKRGLAVQVLPFRKAGVLIEDAPTPACEKSMVRVSMGGIKITVDAGDLRLLPEKANKKEPGERKALQSDLTFDIEPSPTPSAQSNTLDLRGLRAHEAEAEVVRYLDEACLKGTPNVFIIHGHGTGVLKQIVREYLATSPYVRSFRPGQPEEGGDGVTMVILNRMG